RAMSRGTAMLISALGPPAPKLRNTSRKLSQPICGWSISTWVPSDSTRRSLMVTPCTSMRMPGSSCAMTSTCPPTSPTLSRDAEAMSMTRSSPGAMSHFSVMSFSSWSGRYRDISRVASVTRYISISAEAQERVRKRRLTLTRRQLLRWNSSTDRGGTMDWSIQEIARLTGTTSRALRHYDDIGLLTPSRVARNGYRHYDEAALLRLQRILLLRELGLGLTQIADVIDRETSEASALESHLAWLRQEQERLTRQIASVESTITALKGGEDLMAENMFDGFDHTRYREEVEERWGAKAYAESDRWWRGMPDEERAGWKQLVSELGRD